MKQFDRESLNMEHGNSKFNQVQIENEGENYSYITNEREKINSTAPKLNK